jgi:hypothetical protein
MGGGGIHCTGSSSGNCKMCQAPPTAAFLGYFPLPLKPTAPSSWLPPSPPLTVDRLHLDSRPSSSDPTHSRPPPAVRRHSAPTRGRPPPVPSPPAAVHHRFRPHSRLPASASPGQCGHRPPYLTPPRESMTCRPCREPRSSGRLPSARRVATPFSAAGSMTTGGGSGVGRSARAVLPSGPPRLPDAHRARLAWGSTTPLSPSRCRPI